MISFVIPAHNEEPLIAETIDAIHAAAAATGEDHEVVVADDASTDRTAEIARRGGARVVSIDRRQIAAARNAGAREARGDVLFFVDADTRPTADTVRASLHALHGGAVGGGCLFDFDRRLPLWVRGTHAVGMLLARATRVVGGCFVFCTREAYEAVGGFDERYFVTEEIVFSRALRRLGRFVIPRPRVITSARKVRVTSVREVLRLVGRWIRRGPEGFRDRDGLDLWYGPRARPEGDAPPADG